MLTGLQILYYKTKSKIYVIHVYTVYKIPSDSDAKVIATRSSSR